MAGLELHEACTLGDYDSLEEYLKTGKYDVNAKDPEWHNRTALHWACSKGFVDCIRLLLEYGAKGTVRMSMGWTPAHSAAETGKLGVLRALHTAGVPINKPDKYGDKPVRTAQVYGHTECVKYLLQAEHEIETKAASVRKDDQDSDTDWDSESDFDFDSPR